jgi:type II pantothenate kinase
MGDNKNVDLLVEDIYGGNYENIGLEGYMIASTFGKLGNRTTDVKNPKREDIIKSLLYMISDNICQIAYLSIRNDETIKNIYFTGSFTNIGPVLWKKLSYGIEFWSQETITAKFLRHEGYFGAIGVSLD